MKVMKKVFFTIVYWVVLTYITFWTFMETIHYLGIK